MMAKGVNEDEVTVAAPLVWELFGRVNFPGL